MSAKRIRLAFIQLLEKKTTDQKPMVIDGKVQLWLIRQLAQSRQTERVKEFLDSLNPNLAYQISPEDQLWLRDQLLQLNRDGDVEDTPPSGFNVS